MTPTQRRAERSRGSGCPALPHPTRNPICLFIHSLIHLAITQKHPACPELTVETHEFSKY